MTVVEAPEPLVTAFEKMPEVKLAPLTVPVAIKLASVIVERVVVARVIVDDGITLLDVAYCVVVVAGVVRVFTVGPPAHVDCVNEKDCAKATIGGKRTGITKTKISTKNAENFNIDLRDIIAMFAVFTGYFISYADWRACKPAKFSLYE
jgi:hypothetical protein